MSITDIVVNAPWLLLLLFIAIAKWYGISLRPAIVVTQATTRIVLRMGAYSRTLDPGFHWMIPMLESLYDEEIDMQENYVVMDKQRVITKDNAVVNIDAAVFWQILNPAQYAFDMGGGVEISATTQATSHPSRDMYAAETLKVLATTNLRAVIGAMELDEILSHREQINEKLVTHMGVAVAAWGIRISRVELKDVLPDEAMIQTLDMQMKAERSRRAQVLTAEGTKQAAILQAQGEKEAAFLKAEARERTAQAEAMATSLMSDAIRDGDVQSINYFVAQEYLKALGQLANSPNEKILIMPTELTGIIGSLAGMAEIAKSAFAPKGNGIDLAARTHGLLQQAFERD